MTTSQLEQILSDYNTDLDIELKTSEMYDFDFDIDQYLADYLEDLTEDMNDDETSRVYKYMYNKAHKMTTAEKQRLRKLQNNLTYGRGVFLEAWPELIELRKKDLISRNENPYNYDLEARSLMKKFNA